MQDKVHSAFFRELYGRYSFTDVKAKLKFSDDDKIKSVLKSLKSAGIVKVVDKDSDSFDMDRLQEQEIITDEISADSNRSYVFNFVGIAYTENCVIKCFPKYIDDEKYFDSDDADTAHFKKVLQVLKKYKNTKTDNIRYFDYNGGKNFNRMEIELFILEDFFQNGIYTNQENIIETNGDGEIDWDRTINNTLAIIKDTKPYYMELQTIKSQNDDQDYFKLLHECVVTECSRHLGKDGADILDLFDMEGAELSSVSLSDFGDTEYIKYRLEQELRNQFVTQKQNLLKMLLAYVSEREFGNQTSDFSFFGTNAFNMVWEKACSAVFDDVKEKYNHLIENAKWSFNDTASNPSLAKDTLRPDTICLHNNHFYILDSKYYIYENLETKGLPGTQDIIKQFAYHKAFYNFLFASKIENVSNSFLIPQKASYWQMKRKVSNEGEVCLDFMQNYYLDLLAPIQLIALNPNYVYTNFLNNNKCMNFLEEIKEYKVVPQPVDEEKNIRYCAVGYLRPEYFNKIKVEKLQNFIFYYYQKLNDEIIEMHPKLPNCTEFIGYSDGNENGAQNEYIQGNIVGSLQIQNKANLKVKLFNRGIEHDPTQDNYYCFDICEVKVVRKEELPPNFDNLLRSGENTALSHEHSPKVIRIE